MSGKKMVSLLKIIGSNFLNLKLMLTIVFGISLLSDASSQNNNYFDNNPRWLQTGACGVPAPCILQTEYIHYFENDTLINNTTYKILRKVGTGNHVWLAPPPSQNCTGAIAINEISAYIRQDNKQVYIYDLFNATEELLYDFDLNVGDTLPESYNHFFSNYLIISSIDFSSDSRPARSFSRPTR